MTARDKIKAELERIKRESALNEEWNKIHAAEKAKFSKEEVINEDVQQIHEETAEVQEPVIKASKKNGGKKAARKEIRDSVEVEDVYAVPDELVRNVSQEAEQTPAEMDTEGFKSEIAKQLFDIPRNKILQRTELPRRMILPMSMMKTSIFLTTAYHTGKETGPEHWMNEYGYLMLSAGRKVRMEGMAAFQPNPEGAGSENINF